MQHGRPSARPPRHPRAPPAGTPPAGSRERARPRRGPASTPVGTPLGSTERASGAPPGSRDCGPPRARQRGPRRGFSKRASGASLGSSDRGSPRARRGGPASAQAGPHWGPADMQAGTPPGSRPASGAPLGLRKHACVAHDRLRAQEARLKTAGARQGHGVFGVAQGGLRPRGQRECLGNSGVARSAVV